MLATHSLQVKGAFAPVIYPRLSRFKPDFDTYKYI